MTLLINKFQYIDLERHDTPKGRRYSTPGGNKVPSVTTILDATKSEESKASLENWRKAVGHKKASEITTEAANRGTRMHKYLELYVETGQWPDAGSNPYAKQSHKMAEIIRDTALVDIDEYWGSEAKLYSEDLYAGTADLVCVYKGNPSICDFKQTNKPKKQEWVTDYYLQMVAYILAHNQIHDTDIKEGHVFMCSKDFQYQQFDLLPEDFPYWKNKWWDRVYDFYENHN